MSSDSEKTRRRYDRIAPYFEVLESVLEGLFFSRWRKLLWSKARGPHILEVGVGTGKNFPLYPQDANITAIDFSPKMLEQAQNKRDRKHINVDLELMDVESLCYADNSFDTVIATFVFCSVPRPNKGLQELYRVCKPGGQVLLLEHVLSSNKVMAAMMNLMNPLIKSLVGANINRQTLKNVQARPFQKVLLDPASGDMVKLIRAIK
ncbi:class I SAM-dependent methyltransferase [Methylomarinum sp. Ch1-1]|uniref:Class I SAM-dependent methyltransferase n=1 Tax=Methylomarinum roseum TaxID=3067653 RepID=A0AAU7NWL4_9GAMM|nr:class I SAM-dependent methyltransferase [Methylomarinum sp. Ch1-1]MDP4522605.1 class I SAM-dependent methyltransferase [Methylomarinum sp. Ch1-1]